MKQESRWKQCGVAGPQGAGSWEGWGWVMGRLGFKYWRAQKKISSLVAQEEVCPQWVLDFVSLSWHRSQKKFPKRIPLFICFLQNPVCNPAELAPLPRAQSFNIKNPWAGACAYFRGESLACRIPLLYPKLCYSPMNSAPHHRGTLTSAFYVTQHNFIKRHFL